MSLALESIGGSLAVYGAARYRPELLSGLLAQVTELKNAAVTPEALLAASASAEDSLKRKLCDVALCLDAYDAVLAQGGPIPPTVSRGLQKRSAAAVSARRRRVPRQLHGLYGRRRFRCSRRCSRADRSHSLPHLRRACG